MKRRFDSISNDTTGFLSETDSSWTASDDAEPAEGGRFALESSRPFRLLALLGAGGMGEVYLAYDETLDRNVALKTIRADKQASEDYRQRLEAEARITSQLQHPSILPVYHYEKSPGDAFYTMRPVEGVTLRELLFDLQKNPGSRNDWPTARIVRLFIQAMNAVAYAHSRGVLHRDLKPDNIMIGPFEEVLVLDWGVAKSDVVESDGQAIRADRGQSIHSELAIRTVSKVLVGTPAYMAPEQFGGRGANQQTEVFSLGVILYELLALRYPWEANRVKDLLEAMQTLPPLPSLLRPGRRIPQHLGEVVLKAIDADPDERFPTVESFSRAVASALEGRAPWRLGDKSLVAENWRLADGRRTAEDSDIVLRSRGNKASFKYFSVERFADNSRVEFDMRLRKGSTDLCVWLNTHFGQRHQITGGYCLAVVAGRRRLLSLVRSGLDVAGAKSPEYVPGRWYRVVALREGNRFSLLIDGEEIYTYTDPVALTGGFIGLTGKTTGVRLRNLKVYTRGTDVMVSCLSVPDAFFNRGLYEEARAEYQRIAESHPGRVEGQLASFRAGLCMIEMSRHETDDDVRSLILDEARSILSARQSVMNTCLLPLGRAMAAAESRAISEKREALAEALSQHPEDPHLPAVRDWLLGRLHSMDAEDRHGLAELLPLAIGHCMRDWGRRIVSDLVRTVRHSWETPSFLNRGSRFREGDPVSHAETVIFFTFWSGRAGVLCERAQELLKERRVRPHHVADAVLALCELDEVELAERLLEHAVRQAGAAPFRQLRCVLATCEVTVLTARGHLEKAERIFDRSDMDPNDRSCNASRISLARAFSDAGQPERALRILARDGRVDSIGREHRAWVHLMERDGKRAWRELQPLVDRQDHVRGRNLVNLLYGAHRLLVGKRDEALDVFSSLKRVEFPRTWTLGSHYFASRLGDGRLEDYLRKAFYWERKTLEHHRKLLDRVRS